MPGYAVESGAAAFSNTLEQAMLNREKQKRQDMLDHLAVQKAAREVDTEANRAEEHKQDLAERKREFDENHRFKEIADTRQEVKDLAMGDVPDPELVARAKKHGVALPTTPPLAAPPIAGMTPPNMAGVAPGSFRGSPIQQQRQGFVDTLPEGPQKTAYQAEQMGLHAVAAPKEAKEPTLIKVVSRDKSGRNVEQWMTPEEAKSKGQMESPTQPKPAGALGGGGAPIKFTYTDPATKKNMERYITREQALELPPTLAASQPGAGPIAAKEEARKEVIPVLNYMDTLIDKASSSLGPRVGRIADFELKVGDNDPTLSALAMTMKTVRMMYDAGLGGTRAAASSQLLKQWDDLMALKATPENLHAITKTARAIMGGEEAMKAETSEAPKKKLTPQEVANKYLSK